MNLLGVGDLVKSIGGIADDLFTSDEERLKIALQEKSIAADLTKGQLAINAAEAQHKSVFVAGWRPFIGWIGGLAMAYQFLLYPLLVWIWTFAQTNGWLPCYIDSQQATGPCTFTSPPQFDSGELYTIVLGMLGIGGMRSFDKMRGTDTPQMKPSSKGKSSKSGG